MSKHLQKRRLVSLHERPNAGLKNDVTCAKDDLRDDNPLLYLLGIFYWEREFIPYRLQELEPSHHHKHVYFKPGCRRHLGVSAEHASYHDNNCQRALDLRTHSLCGARIFHNFVVHSVSNVSWHDRHQPLFLHRQVEHIHHHLYKEKSVALRSRRLVCLNISGIPSTLRLGRISLHPGKILLLRLLALERVLHVFYDYSMFFWSFFGHGFFLLQYFEFHEKIENES